MISLMWNCFLKREQVQNEDKLSFVFKYVLGNSKELSLTFLNAQKQHRRFSKATYVSPNSVSVNYAYKSICYFIIPNSKVSYIFLLLIICGFLIYPGKLISHPPWMMTIYRIAIKKLLYGTLLFL
jgi:hypothetical protein